VQQRCTRGGGRGESLIYAPHRVLGFTPAPCRSCCLRRRHGAVQFPSAGQCRRANPAPPRVARQRYAPARWPQVLTIQWLKRRARTVAPKRVFTAIIAEIFRLSEYIPDEFRLATKEHQRNYGEILLDFSYFKIAEAANARIENNPVRLTPPASSVRL